MDFKEKLAQLAERNKNREKQLEDEKQTWISEVNRLYEEIKNWLSESVERGHVSFEYSDLTHFEFEEFFENISIMELNLGGGPWIVFEPTGINIIGAFGKIDLYMRGYKEEKVMLLLVENDKNSLQWELWKSNKNRDRFLFDRNIFEKLMSEWIDKVSDEQGD